MRDRRIQHKSPPKLGDKIVHHEPYFERNNEGTVVEVLAAQFVYETKDGQTRYCLFREDWSYKEKT